MATAGTKRLLVAEHGQNWPLQVLQGGEESLRALRLINCASHPLRSVSPVDKSRMNQICGSPPWGAEAIQGNDQAALLLHRPGQSPALLTFVAREGGGKYTC